MVYEEIQDLKAPSYLKKMVSNFDIRLWLSDNTCHLSSIDDCTFIRKKNEIY